MSLQGFDSIHNQINEDLLDLNLVDGDRRERLFKVALDGKVLGVIGRSGRNLGQFSGAHALACPSEHEIYGAETSNWRVQKLLLH